MSSGVELDPSGPKTSAPLRALGAWDTAPKSPFTLSSTPFLSFHHRRSTHRWQQRPPLLVIPATAASYTLSDGSRHLGSQRMEQARSAKRSFGLYWACGVFKVSFGMAFSF